MESGFIVKSGICLTCILKRYKYNDKIDHDWHEFESVENSSDSATEVITLEDFLLLICKAKVK